MAIETAMEEVERLIQKKGYHAKFSLLIREYFERSIIVYKWSEEVFYKKLQNYEELIETITFERIKKDERKGANPYIRMAGNANYFDKKLSIARTFSAKNLILSGFHEQEHFTDVTQGSYENGLIKGYEEKQLLNELATEIGSIKLFGEKQYSDELYTTHIMHGYDELQYACSMMAAALGIKEFEFAILRDKGRAYFDEILRERFGYMNIENYIERFSMILKQIHECVGFRKYISDGYAKMYNLADEVIRERIAYEQEKKEGKELQDFKAKTVYESYKIVANMKAAKKNLGLSKKAIQKNVERDDLMKKYSRITGIERKALKEIADEIYQGDVTEFDNSILVKNVRRNIIIPMGRILSIIKRSKTTKLLTGNGTNDSIKEAFKDEIKATTPIPLSNEQITEEQEVRILEKAVEKRE